MNEVTLSGNLTRDPELRYTSNGTAVSNISIAHNHNTHQVSFFQIVAWGEDAEWAADNLHKGQKVVVNGRLKQRKWESKDGSERNAVEIVASEISTVPKATVTA